MDRIATYVPTATTYVVSTFVQRATFKYCAFMAFND